MRALVGIPDADFRRSLIRHVERRGRAAEPGDRLDVLACETAAAAIAAARTGRPAVALVDGLLLERAELVAALGDAPLVVRGARGRVDDLPPTCVAILGPEATAEEGAFALERARDHVNLTQRAARAEARLGAERGELVVASKAMRDLVRRAKRCATNEESALVIGEPGTGKELLASVAAGAGPSRRVDLSRATEDDAMRVVRSLDAAETNVLLHVERLSVDAQSALLDALLGGASGRRAPRVVATADASIHGMLAARTFDKSLFIALAPATLDVPPLRARRDDIPLIAHHLLSLERDRRGLGPAKIAAGAMRALRAHPWALNVTELQAVVAHAAVVMRGSTLVEGDLPFDRAGDARPLADEPYPAARERAIRAFEDAYVKDAMTRTSENIAQAAVLAGMDRANFRRLLRRTRAR